MIVSSGDVSKPDQTQDEHMLSIVYKHVLTDNVRPEVAVAIGYLIGMALRGSRA